MGFPSKEVDRYFSDGLYLPKRLICLGDADRESYDKFIRGITLLDSISSHPIIVHMNNCGGDEYDGMAVYDSIQACRCYVTIVVWGNAMSMGSVILQSADLRVLAPNSVVMIHDGHWGGIELDAKSQQAWSDEAAAWRKKMYKIYWVKMREKTPRITLKKVEDLCSHDTIYTPTEAVSAGLADSVLEGLSELEGGKNA